MKRFFFLPLFIILLTVIIINPVFASPAITLTPSTGVVGTSVTVQGSGFSPATSNSSTNNFTSLNSGTWNSNIWLERFSGLTPGSSINSLTVKTGNAVGKASAVVYKDNGNSTYFNNDNGENGNNGAAWNGNIWCARTSSLPVGHTINHLALNVNTAAGNVRVKIYNDTGSVPGALLGESGSIAVSTTGWDSFAVAATIPISGSVWACFETDSVVLNVTYKALQPLGTGKTVAHVYGAGPDPFGAYVSRTDVINTRLTYDITVSQYPGTRISNSTSLPITITGLNTFPLSGVIPPSGAVWIGFQVNSSAQNFYYSAGHPAGVIDSVNNISYFNNPDPAGLNVTQRTDAPYMQINWGSLPTFPITIKWDGSVLSTTPASLFTNTTGGFSGMITTPYSIIGPHTVNASDSAGLFATKIFTIINGPSSIGFPYVTNLYYTNLTPNSITLKWVVPDLTGFIFQGYQIRYTTPFGTPNTILVNNTNSSSITYLISGLTPGTQYSFQIGTWANNTNFHTLASILDVTALTNNPPSLSPGNLTLNAGINPLHVGYQFYLQTFNTTKKDLFVSYPSSYNTTCNLSYSFANINKNYYNLSTVGNGTNRVKADFQLFNIGNEIITTVCRDVITNDTGHYVITNSIDTIPLVQQVHNFDNGLYGTSGQFGGFDLVELLVIIISMIALNRVNETLGAIIMVFVLGGLAFFHIGSLPVIIFGAIAMIILLIVATTKKLSFTP